jgi:hypothetical protein
MDQDIRRFFQPPSLAGNMPGDISDFHDNTKTTSPTVKRPCIRQEQQIHQPSATFASVKSIDSHNESSPISEIEGDWANEAPVISEERDIVKQNNVPTVCKVDQFSRWRQKWPWLQGKKIDEHDDIGVYCTMCSEVGSLGRTLFVKERCAIEKKWISGMTANNSKKLHDKISEHAKSTAHKLCEEHLTLKEKDLLKQSVRKAWDVWKAQNEQKFETTKRIFNTSYTIAKKSFSFCSQEALVQLQIRNGIDMGEMLFSDHSCQNIVCHIAQCMQKKLVQYILDTETYFSILIDESTTTANRTALIVYLRFIGPNSEACNAFLSLIELQGTKGADIADALFQNLVEVGLTVEIMTRKLLSFCTDGASNLTGEINGAITLFMQKLGRMHFVKQHCMNHKLELAAHKAADTNSHVLHLRLFVDSLYAYFSQSPKNLRALASVAAELHVQLIKIGRIFDIRWLSSTYRSINALWISLPALLKLFHEQTSSPETTSKARATTVGMISKMKSWTFIMELALLRDVLALLQHLSLFLQRRDTSLLNIRGCLQTTIKSLIALKTNDSLSLSQVTTEYNQHGTTLGITVDAPTEKAVEQFQLMRKQYVQSVVDNISVRFPDDELLRAGSALDPETWPTDEIEKAFHCDRELTQLAQLLDVDPVSAVNEFREYKNNVKKVGATLKELMCRVLIVPVSSAECERGFSQMNLDDTALRSRLQISTLSALIFIKVNGPPTKLFQPDSYVRQWIESGRHAATDKPTGKLKKEKNVKSSIACLFI